MAIPPGPRDADEWDAGFDQPAGDQDLLTELGGPEVFANAHRLTRDIEERLAGHQAAHALIGHVVAAQSTRRPPAFEPPAQEVAKLGTLGGGRARRYPRAGASFRGSCRRSSNIGLVLLAHLKTARAERGSLAPFGGRVERDVIGHGAFGLTELAGEDRPHIGVTNAGVIAAAVHHQLGAAAVVAVFCVE